MGLPKVNIKLGNGNLGQSSATDDGVAGLILTGKAVEGQLELNKSYQLSSTRDLATLGITEENNDGQRGYHAHCHVRPCGRLSASQTD